jgi:hypothetical protein
MAMASTSLSNWKDWLSPDSRLSAGQGMAPQLLA